MLFKKNLTFILFCFLIFFKYSNGKSCGSFNPSFYTCCKGVLISGSGQSCCGTTTFNPSFYTCCRGVLNSGSGQSCCGTTAFNPSFYSCCNGVLNFGSC